MLVPVQIIKKCMVKMLLLLNCWIFTGFTGIMANDQSERQYRLKNSSMCLNVRGSVDKGEWTVNNTLLAKPDQINPTYQERVVYFSGNSTMCIKNLTESDTGVYQVSYFDSNLQKTSDTSHIIVQEMIPKPVITVTRVPHANRSTGFCNITVNCSIQDYWLWSICDEDGCRESHKSFKKLNITLFTDNRTVVCSGRNHVSTKNISESIPTLCLSGHKPDDVIESGSSIVMVTIFIFSIFAGIFAWLLIKQCISKKNSGQQTTAADQLIENGPVEEQLQPERRVSTSSSEAEASYENVDITQQRSSGPREGQNPKESQLADTIYSVPRPVGSYMKGDSKKATDSKVRKSTLTSESECSTPVDTVYSLLEKPKT